MKEIRQTEKLIIFEEKKGQTTSLFRQHKDDERQEKVLIYKQKSDAITYPFEGVSIKKIEFRGFEELPGFINGYGYGFLEKSINNFFKYKFSVPYISRLVISQKQIRKAGVDELLIHFPDLQELLTNINQEKRAHNDTLNILITNFLLRINPSLPFEGKETNNNKELIIRNLNSKLIEKLTAEDVDKLGKFYVEAASKYKRPDIVNRMVHGLQKNSQLITLTEVIKKYESLIQSNPAESAWQSFFNDYITLFDNRYARKIDYKNIATGITKYPDLVLVDIYGYINFYELKKSGMPLLQYDDSHKTFYWSKELSMTIAQASDYLQKARENSLSYANSIKMETATPENSGLDVNIINPRAIIVAGTSDQLNTAKKKHHFKNLRESLKDVEFVLYDELLARLKNLLNSIKIN